MVLQRPGVRLGSHPKPFGYVVPKLLASTLLNTVSPSGVDRGLQGSLTKGTTRSMSLDAPEGPDLSSL